MQEQAIEVKEELVSKLKYDLNVALAERTESSAIDHWKKEYTE